jgi:hypothetical protein
MAAARTPSSSPKTSASSWATPKTATLKLARNCSFVDFLLLLNASDCMYDMESRREEIRENR